MSNCKWCGSDVPPGLEHCLNCGQVVESQVQDPGGAPPGLPPVTAVGAPSQANLPSGRVKEERPVWMKGPRMDPLYIVAFAIAWVSVAFFWIPKMNILLCCIALVISGIGFVRYFTNPDGYGAVWFNVVASVVALLSLVLAIRVTLSVGQGNAPALLRVLHFLL